MKENKHGWGKFIRSSRFIFLGITLGLGVLYVVWPYVCLYSFYESLRQRDSVALERHIDWPMLKSSLAGQIKRVVYTSLSSKGEQAKKDNDPSNRLAYGFLTLVAPTLVDRLLEVTVKDTKSLVALINNAGQLHRYASALKGQVLPTPRGAKTEEADAGESKDSAGKIKVAYAFFVTPTSFHVTLITRKNAQAESPKRGEKDPQKGTQEDSQEGVTLVFKLKDFTWKLTRVILPLQNIEISKRF